MNSKVMGRCIVYVANTSWYLYNFRYLLMKKMALAGWRVIAVAPKDRYSEHLVREGNIRYVAMPMKREMLTPFSDLKSLWWLYDFYRREQPDLVHHYTVKPVVYGSLAAWAAKVPGLVNEVTGLGHVFSRSGLKERVLKAGLMLIYWLILNRENGRVIFQNADDRQTFITAGLVRSEYAVLIRGSGVDVKRFAPIPEPEGEPTIVLCGRMLWSKGVSDLVDAARLLRKGKVPGCVILVGDCDPGNEAAIPRAQLEDWDSEGIIRWLGHLEEMEKVYASTHIVGLPTTYGEGIPRSLVEAAACGRPVVATDVAGCREIIRNGENGFLVPVRDSKALADALTVLVQNPTLRRNMGARGREIVVAEFSAEHVLGATLALYDELLNQVEGATRRK